MSARSSLHNGTTAARRKRSRFAVVFMGLTASWLAGVAYLAVVTDGPTDEQFFAFPTSRFEFAVLVYVAFVAPVLVALTLVAELLHWWLSPRVPRRASSE